MHIPWFLWLISAWLLLALAAFLFSFKNSCLQRTLRIIPILLAAITTTMGFWEIIYPQTAPIIIPGILWGFHPSLQLDPLSSFFVMLLGICYLGISVFSLDYLKHFTPSQQKKIHLWEMLFITTMLLVFTAHDPLMFLFAWECMALSSYFLVSSIDPSKVNRKAGLLYLGIAHIGFFAIALSFFILFSDQAFSTWQFTHTLLSNQSMANAVFIFALIGFGAKAGLFPLHVWLPEAHPAAPSPISALMSGVMLTTAIYSLIRFMFEFLLPYQQIWWGYSLVSLGLITMFIGIIHAAMQTDMKRLLAYSSIENMGLIVTVLGLAIIFYQFQQFSLADLALIIALLHTLNHGIFKSLLFLGTGSILHATGERNFGKLGGLIHTMPWVSVCTLIGTLAMAGLPLFNGFISEWLYLSLFFHHSAAFYFSLAIFSPLIVATSVLVFALAGFVIVKFYGIAFLGQAREPQLLHTKPSSAFERIGLSWLAFLCVILGLFPNGLISLIQTVNLELLPNLQIGLINPSVLNVHINVIDLNSPHGFNPAILAAGLMIILVLTYGIVRRISAAKIRRAAKWDCGFPFQTARMQARMQDSAEGFGQPFKQTFSQWISIKLHLPKPSDEKPYYQSQLTEKIWHIAYIPLISLVRHLAVLTKWIQQGRISTYLLYIGLTLLLILIWVVWL